MITLPLDQRLVGWILLFTCIPLAIITFWPENEKTNKFKCFTALLMKRCEIAKIISKNKSLDKYMVDFWVEKTLRIIERGTGKRVDIFDRITASFDQIIKDQNTLKDDNRPPMNYRKPEILACIKILDSFIRSNIKSINDLHSGFECADLEEFKVKDEKEYRRVIGGISTDYLP